jgi:hypothetical protein
MMTQEDHMTERGTIKGQRIKVYMTFLIVSKVMIDAVEVIKMILKAKTGIKNPSIIKVKA